MEPAILARLKGEEIPLGARIFSVADTLDAITSDRPYRPAQSLCKRRAIEIEKWSGRQFDPEVVKVFLEMPDNDLGRSAERTLMPRSTGLRTPLGLRAKSVREGGNR